MEMNEFYSWFGAFTGALSDGILLGIPMAFVLSKVKSKHGLSVAAGSAHCATDRAAKVLEETAVYPRLFSQLALGLMLLGSSTLAKDAPTPEGQRNRVATKTSLGFLGQALLQAGDLTVHEILSPVRQHRQNE